MLEPWLELPGAREFLGTLGDAARIDLLGLGTTADAATIKDTAVAQPLIVGASLLALHLLEGEVGPVAGWAGLSAGHSVGEFAAVAAAGILTAAEAVELVGVRGRAMAAAATAADTGMAAVVGGDPDEVTTAIVAAGLVPANVNGGGQIVAAGARADLEALAAAPPAKARVIPLAVAGAFHTRYMAPAVPDVAAAAGALTPAAPTLAVLSNATGEPVPSGPRALELLVDQITHPVRWDRCQETMVSRGVTTTIELAPGGVLSGLARRSMPGVATIAIKKPADLDSAIAAIKESR
nr:ACP S-malonyltransferase [Pseudactinotalea sp. HY160]